MIGQHIKSRRRVIGWTQKELAVIAGLNCMDVSRIERGARVDGIKLIKIAHALRIDGNDLIDFVLRNYKATIA